ncbi:hypothetical protein B5E87_00300 [Massilimicrobiota sp. An142]|uniref:hypothetical protein n=1 Tax=Massilimicrobiota sp. An142 TaxID=1965564 RepID=UPI000B3691EC|nr:hypothetical protein [Massilimicrobiota sp. An142]OUQ15046.1 hypothetical protein B5E87_00300 [Massilimicrobiota sp. An142]
MTEKNRITIYLLPELYDEFKEIEYKTRGTKRYIYIFLSKAVSVLLENSLYRNDVNFNRTVCNHDFLEILLKEYGNNVKRMSMTLTDEVYDELIFLKKQGFDINIFINYAIFIRVKYFQKHGK